jgi:two-component system chemotaxis response regulator CheB
VTIRVLAADDSAMMRRTIRKILESDPELEVVGVARDGEDALAKARELRPDVISMDINMPKMDGLTALQLIVEEQLGPVVMLSSLTQQGAVTTFEALELGAFDFVGKPGGTVSANLDEIGRELIVKLKAAARGRRGGAVARRRQREAARPPPLDAPTRTTGGEFGYKAVVMGISTGGPSTIMEVLPLFPADVPAALFLVQHMPANFLTEFARRLDDSCAIKVVEAESGMRVEPGVCYVGRGDHQLAVMRKASGEVIIRTPTYPKTLFMPSVGVMMESVLKVYGAATVGVLMTGIGDDGADAMVEIRARGGHTIAESAETAVVFGMPREAAERGGAAVVAPSHEITREVLRAL